MKALIIAAMISSNGMVIGPNTTQRFMAQRPGEPLIHVESWDALKCAKEGDGPVIRMLPGTKTVVVTCEQER